MHLNHFLASHQMTGVDVVEYVLAHAEGLVDEIKPNLKGFLETEAMFSDVPEVFQSAYEEFLLSELYSCLISTGNMEYNVLIDILDFKTTTKLLGLDTRGRNVSA